MSSEVERRTVPFCSRCCTGRTASRFVREGFRAGEVFEVESVCWCRLVELFKSFQYSGGVPTSTQLRTTEEAVSIEEVVVAYIEEEGS
ncbi:hypothetical protein TYRP_022782 [Tyrophagus putrescentiae]|nr:hypothetical protein TYRP_022782 [Tyrophagus putrescentiae]